MPTRKQTTPSEESHFYRYVFTFDSFCLANIVRNKISDVWMSRRRMAEAVQIKQTSPKKMDRFVGQTDVCHHRLRLVFNMGQSSWLTFIFIEFQLNWSAKMSYLFLISLLAVFLTGCEARFYLVPEKQPFLLKLSHCSRENQHNCHHNDNRITNGKLSTNWQEVASCKWSFCPTASTCM